MANKTILMTKVRQILSYYQQGTQLKEICRLTGVSRNTIKRYIQQYVLEELSWEDVEPLSDYELDMLFANLTDIQEKQLDRHAIAEPDHREEMPEHDNIRGSGYYH